MSEFVETCSCGARFELDLEEAPWRWADQWERYQATLSEWRKSHRHVSGRDNGEATSEVVHRCPPTGTGLTPCCGRTPFELPRTDRMTVDADLVTCIAGSSQPYQVGENP